ncbi:MAG: peroxidase [Cytophagaceae bacterium]|nr:peroxidase [Gemmatimonadaceae bacterium]
MVDAVLEDFRTAPISDMEKALFAFVEKINRKSTDIAQADIDAMKAAGWSEEAIYDAITVCALFRFYNTWIDATGVSDMSSDAYLASGVRMAEHGYGQ